MTRIFSYLLREAQWRCVLQHIARKRRLYGHADESTTFQRLISRRPEIVENACGVGEQSNTKAIEPLYHVERSGKRTNYYRSQHLLLSNQPEWGEAIHTGLTELIQTWGTVDHPKDCHGTTRRGKNLRDRYPFKVGGGAITSRSEKPNAVAVISTEARYTILTLVL